MKEKIFIVFILAVVFAVPAVMAQSCCSTYNGYVYINSLLAANGTVVQSYINGVNTTNVTSFSVGSNETGGKGSGYYIVNVPGAPGDNVSFRVNGVAVIAMNGTNSSSQPWNIGWHAFNLTMNTSANGVACAYAGGCTSGYCADGYCCNSACTDSGYDCNVAGSLGTCTSTGGGGGGGSSSSGGTVSESQTSSSSDTEVLPGESASFVFTKTPVEKIEVNASGNIVTANVTVSETSKPATASVAISSTEGSVYKYLEIKPSFTNDKINEAKIQFKVPKTWITNNKIAPETIVLKKLIDNQWVPLTTTQLKFDGTNYFFEATTTSFSTYVVTGSKSISFIDLVNKIDQYYQGKVQFFDLIGFIDTYYKTQVIA